MISLKDKLHTTTHKRMWRFFVGSGKGNHKITNIIMREINEKYSMKEGGVLITDCIIPTTNEIIKR